jgi:hypothetical protein
VTLLRGGSFALDARDLHGRSDTARGATRKRGREPSGTAYLHRGTEALRELYTHMFANAGGIGLEHCTLTDDGVRCAIEYDCVRWGTTDIPPQAGVAIYERSASGLLAAARIYDDVEPPSVSDTSMS